MNMKRGYYTKMSAKKPKNAKAPKPQKGAKTFGEVFKMPAKKGMC